MTLKSFLLIIAIATANLSIGQIVSSNGWYFPKTPMSNVFGYPFTDVVEKNKEAVVSNGTVLTIDSAIDLSVNQGFNYSKIFEESWRKIMLGSLYQNNKNIQLKVESWRAKRWVFNRNRFKDFDENTFYPVEGISADSIRITCKVVKKNDADSKIVEDILKTYLKANTVAFTVLDAFQSNKADTLKGLLQFMKKDSTEFVIDINKSNVLYALKFGRIKVKNKQYFKVQDSYALDKEIPFSAGVRKTLMNYTYTPAGASPANVYVDLIRKNVADKSPKLIIFNQNAKDTIELKSGEDIGDGLLHFEGDAIYKKTYGGDKVLQVNFCYDFDYDTKRNVIILKGYDEELREFLNCIYKLEAYFDVYP